MAAIEDLEDSKRSQGIFESENSETNSSASSSRVRHAFTLKAQTKAVSGVNVSLAQYLRQKGDGAEKQMEGICISRMLTWSSRQKNDFKFARNCGKNGGISKAKMACSSK